MQIGRESSLGPYLTRHMHLKSHQFETLRRICNQGSVPVSDIDGRVLRPLLRLNLVVDTGTSVRATPAGQGIARQEASQPIARGPVQGLYSVGSLSASQEEVLRYLVRQTGPVPVDHLDGRVLRALLSRGLVEVTRGWVCPTEAAEPHLRGHVRKVRERSVRRAVSSARGARSEAILRATEELEKALPRGAELMIASIPAYGDDVVAGLRRFAREME